jgi:RNA polymerase-binding transcription factor DksA
VIEDLNQSAIRAKLLAQQHELEGRIEKLESNAERELSSREPTYADQAQDLLRHERMTARIEQAKAQLTQVTAALNRLEEGSYGDCLRCGEPIAPERQQALPHATLCVECQENRDTP